MNFYKESFICLFLGFGFWLTNTTFSGRRKQINLSSVIYICVWEKKNLNIFWILEEENKQESKIVVWGVNVHIKGKMI
jgi:hypothetical protein